LQRRLIVLIPTQTRRESQRIRGDDATQNVLEIQRDSRKDVVLRAAADEEVDDRAMGRVVIMPARRPTDHLERVIVAMPDDITAGVGQTPHDVEVRGGRGPMHRIGVVALLARVHVGSALDQFVDRGELAVPRGDVQQRPSVFA
jgi:hypothetical protein